MQIADSDKTLIDRQMRGCWENSRDTMSNICILTPNHEPTTVSQIVFLCCSITILIDFVSPVVLPVVEGDSWDFE